MEVMQMKYPGTGCQAPLNVNENGGLASLRGKLLSNSSKTQLFSAGFVPL